MGLGGNGPCSWELCVGRVALRRTLRYSFLGTTGLESRSEMNLLQNQDIQWAAGLVATALIVATIIWLVLRKRPTEDEQERMRRRLLVQSGRLVDGMLLDLCEVEGDDGRTLAMLIFNYRISGVDYECSQDITQIRSLIDESEMRIGYPCTVRYQPGNPQNSIVIAEGWSGLRARLPQLPLLDAPEPMEKSPADGKEKISTL